MVVDIVQLNPYMARPDEVGNVVNMGDKICHGNTLIIGEVGEVPSATTPIMSTSVS